MNKVINVMVDGEIEKMKVFSQLGFFSFTRDYVANMQVQKAKNFAADMGLSGSDYTDFIKGVWNEIKSDEDMSVLFAKVGNDIEFIIACFNKAVMSDTIINADTELDDLNETFSKIIGFNEIMKSNNAEEEAEKEE